MQVAIHTDTLNETGFVEDTIARDRRPHDPHLPHRGRRRRPRARHHPAVRRAERAPLVHESDDAVHAEHAGRAPRHADGVPSPVAERARRRRVRRLAHPSRDDRGRGRPARPRRVQHDVVRFAGDGTHRRGDLPHLADRRQDEAAARPAAGRSGRQRQPARAGATSRNTRSIRRSRTASRAHVGSIEVGKMADLVLWKPAFFGVKPELIIKGGFIAGAMMGDGNASIPTPQPVVARPMFGAYGAALHAVQRALRQPGRASTRARWRGSRGRWWPCAAAGRSRKTGSGAERRAAEDRGRSRRRTRCAPTASC